jgi:hypothetical protein
MAATIQGIEPVNLVRTPIGASLEQVANDLAGVEGPKVVVLVTDGEETCGGDPAAAIQSLIDQGIDVQVNIVGFALDDDALRAQFRDWARIGNGTYFDATNAQELDQAIASAFQAPFRVLDENGNEVARGTVGGEPIDVPPGTYTVIVLTDPEQRYENVVIEPGGNRELQLAAQRPALCTCAEFFDRAGDGPPGRAGKHFVRSAEHGGNTLAIRKKWRRRNIDHAQFGRELGHRDQIRSAAAV